MARQHIGMSGFDYSNLPAGALFQALIRVLRDRADERLDRCNERDTVIEALHTLVEDHSVQRELFYDCRNAERHSSAQNRSDERRQFYADRADEREARRLDREDARRVEAADRDLERRRFYDDRADERAAWQTELDEERYDRRDERDAWLTVDARNRHDLADARQYVRDLVGDLVDALVEDRDLDRRVLEYERRIEDIEQELSDERANVLDLEVDLMHEQRMREQLETDYAFAERERDRAIEEVDEMRKQVGLTRDELSRLAGYVAQLEGLLPGTGSSAGSGTSGTGTSSPSGAGTGSGGGATGSGGGNAMTDLTDTYRMVWGGLASMSGGGSAATATLPRRPRPRGETRWSRLPEPSVLNFWLKRAYRAYANGDASTAAARFAKLDLPDMTARITYARSLLDHGTAESREQAQRIYDGAWRAADASWRGIIENDLQVFSNKAGFRAPFAIPFLSRLNSQASDTFQCRSLEWMAEGYLQQDRPDKEGARSCYERLLELPLSPEEHRGVVRKLTRIARHY